MSWRQVKIKVKENKEEVVEIAQVGDTEGLS